MSAEARLHPSLRDEPLFAAHLFPVDFGSRTAKVERQGKAAVLLLANPRFLNSEDLSTQSATEIGADVCILDPESQVAVLRGDFVPEGKYAGRRVFNAGINLTHLYYGSSPTRGTI